VDFGRDPPRGRASSLEHRVAAVEQCRDFAEPKLIENAAKFCHPHSILVSNVDAA
jgi:hypothetical protein